MVRRLHWGTSIASTITLYCAAVRSILEHASVVRDSAKPQIKGKLHTVQRYALTAATSAVHTTSTPALEFLCTLETLQQRRDLDAISYVNRCHRLGPCLLRHTYDDWIAGDAETPSVHRHSPFFIGRTRQQYYRVQYTDLDVDMLPSNVLSKKRSFQERTR